MSNFIERIKIEKEELCTKKEALEKFLSSEKFNEMDIENRTLLKQQLEVMTSYDNILYRRLSLLTGNESTQDQTTPVVPPPPKP